MATPARSRLSWSCSGWACGGNHLKKKETNQQLLFSRIPHEPGGGLRRENSHKILTLRFLIDQTSETLCGGGVWQSVLTRAAHLLQLWQQLLRPRHFHLVRRQTTQRWQRCNNATHRPRLKAQSENSRLEVKNTHRPSANKPAGTGARTPPAASEENYTFWKHTFQYYYEE